MVSILLDKESNGFEWIDVTAPSKEELVSIAEKYEMHQSLVNDCLQPDHLPKYEIIGETQFIILRVFDINSNKRAETIQMMTRKIAIFIGANFLITIHRASFDFIDDVKNDYLSQSKFKNQYEIIHKLIQYSLGTYNEPSSRIIKDLDLYETKIFLKEKTPSLLKKIYFIKRKASVISRMLVLTKPILENLQGKLPPIITGDLKDILTASRTNIEQIIENSNNLLNIYISLSSQRTNEVMRVLTIFSVFFMPLTFIVGIYGMNFDFMPELQMKWAYPSVLIFCLVITITIYFWFRRKGWL